MSKTLLEIVNVILPEIGFPTVETVVGNGNQTVRKAMAAINLTGRSMAKHDWRILVKRNVITTTSSAEAYSLPSDFDRFIHNTEWNASQQDRMFGPVSDPSWQADLSGVTQVTVDDRFQIRADGNSNRFYIRPVPTSAENVSFFYVTNTWCRAAGGARKTEFTADNDVNLLDDFVLERGAKARLLKAENRSFELEQAEYMMELGKAKARDGGMKSLRILGPIEEWVPQANVGETSFGT